MKYKFSGAGNFTIVLRKSYKDILRNAVGDVVGTKHVPVTQAMFKNGFFETDDDLTAELLTKHEWFGEQNLGGQFYWNPLMEGKIPDFSPEFNKGKSERMEKTRFATAKAKKKAREARLESGMTKEDE